MGQEKEEKEEATMKMEGTGGGDAR